MTDAQKDAEANLASSERERRKPSGSPCFALVVLVAVFAVIGVVAWVIVNFRQLIKPGNRFWGCVVFGLLAGLGFVIWLFFSVINNAANIGK